MTRTRRNPSTVRTIALLSVAVLATSICLFAPAPASSREGTAGSFGESVDVVVVEVEAVVTDRRDRRVTGLGAEDFRLLVDDREVPIDYFAEIREGRAATVTGGGGVPGPATTEQAEPVPTNYLVFIDEYFSIGSRRDWMLDKTIERLDELPPQDRMAVVAFDGNEIAVLSGWTRSREELRSALRAARKRPAQGLHRADERYRRRVERLAAPFAANWSWSRSRPPLDSVGTARDLFLGDRTSHTASVFRSLGATRSRMEIGRDDAHAQDLELDRVLTALQSAMQVVPRPEGRNVLFLLAGGWPSRPGSGDLPTGLPSGSAILPDVPLTGAVEGSLQSNAEAVLRSLPTGYGRHAPLDDLQMIRPVIDTANLLGYTIYAADVDGLRPTSAGDDRARIGTLRRLSNATGGRALLFGRRAESLAAVVADTRTYYSLGFTPELLYDNAYHDIRVEVRKPGAEGGLDVRARTGYRDFVPDTQLDMQVEAALQFSDQGEDFLGDDAALGVSFDEPERRPRGTMKIPLTVDVPWSWITVLPSSGGRIARLELRVAARDRTGALSETAEIPLGLMISGEMKRDEDLQWEHELVLRRERHDLVISVHDVPSGQSLTRVVTVEP